MLGGRPELVEVARSISSSEYPTVNNGLKIEGIIKVIYENSRYPTQDENLWNYKSATAAKDMPKQLNKLKILEKCFDKTLQQSQNYSFGAE